jgi:DNA polymerase V
MTQPVFALVDCNNFFVSCERLFRPDLENRPVVVLSSNDGCAVSRSNEAKELGIPMGAPAFKYRDVFEKHNVQRFSANFELYGNISRRITTLLTTITPRTEIYSIDESFMDLSQLPITDYEAWGAEVRRLILEWVGIPVSIGIAPSKTLAKLANLQAKKNPELGGVLSFVENRTGSGSPQFNRARAEQYMAKTPVADVWGIGWRLAPKMRAEGAGTALDLAHMRPQRTQQLMGIQGRQLVAELTGTCCHTLTLEGRLPQSIASTRTFGEDTNDLYAIESAMATFIVTATYRLRRSNQLTTRITLFTTTNKHKPGYQSWYREIHLQQPTADPGVLIREVMQVFRALYRPSTLYHRAGIALHNLVPDGQLQTDLLGAVNSTAHDRSKGRMAAVDALNNRYGKRTVRYGSEVLARQWRPKYQLRSPRYVSRWDELPEVQAFST